MQVKTSKHISLYKSNIWIKTLSYDGAGELQGYTTYDHDTWTSRMFSADHELLEEDNMRLYH